jgi:c(7)-type cytochrome triheme protein
MNGRCALITSFLLLTTVSLAAGYELKSVTFKTKAVGNVVFSHKDHLRQKSIKNNCKACHKEGTNKIGRHSMADMEKGKSCGACHNGKKAFALANCEKCHLTRQVSLKSKDIGPITFSHKSHLSRQKCENCHSGIFKAGPNSPVGMAAMEKGKSCGACHNKQKAFGLEKCSACHPAKDVTYKIVGVGPTVFSHDFHLGMYKCKDCHGVMFGKPGSRSAASMQDMEKGKSCGACHDDKQAFSVKSNCAKCHKAA